MESMVGTKVRPALSNWLAAPSIVLRSAARLLELGITDTRPAERRRLMCVNAAAHAATLVGVIFMLNYLLADPWLFRWVLAVNIVMVGVSLSVPLLHRFGPHVGWVVLLIFADINLFAVAAMLGRNAGLHLIILAAPAAMFVMFGLDRMAASIAAIATSVLLYLGAQSSFRDGMLDGAVAPAFLFRLHAISAVGLVFIVASVLYYVLWLNRRAESRIETLMRRTFPDRIAERLMDEPDRFIADACPQASVLFADLVGFVPLSLALGPGRTVTVLNELVSGFDGLAAGHGVERIKTIGDAYMAACGVPEPVEDDRERMARFALAMQAAIRCAADRTGIDLHLRIGIACGPVTAGVIGSRRFSYDIWGEAVNLAARLESRCPADAILVSSEFRAALEGAFVFAAGQTIDIKGFGATGTHVLVSEIAPARSR